jgi:hypothetical protein
MNRISSSRTPALRWLSVAVALFAVIGSLHAHPGHGLLEHGLSHPVTSPFHRAVLALFGATLLAGAHLIQQRFSRRILQGVGGLALMATMVLLAW